MTAWGLSYYPRDGGGGGGESGAFVVVRASYASTSSRTVTMRRSGQQDTFPLAAISSIDRLAEHPVQIL